MILEVAILDVQKGQQSLFEKDFIQASQYIQSIDGYKGHQLKKCIEKENRYLLLVEWADVESHEIGFRQSDVYQKWKELLHHYYSPFPVVEHYESIFENSN